MSLRDLNERERRILEAVIQSYVETAEPAGSRTLARRFGLGVSPATIRNTLSDLEQKGYLYHPHTSAGRVPTDRAYRMYVDSLVQLAPLAAQERDQLVERILAGGSAIETVLRCAAQSLGILTQELGVALGPRLEQTVLRRLELVRVNSERLLLVMTLDGGAIRTIFVEAPGTLADEAIAEVTVVLNERLAGSSLRDIRASLADRLRDGAAQGSAARELLNIFVQEGDSVFDVPIARDEANVVLGQASVLAEQPEFASGDSLRRLLELTETRERLAELLRQRSAKPGISITIGNEHADPRLGHLTIVTAEYHAGPLTGVIGVIGPTRLNYARIVPMVDYTARVVSRLLSG